MSNETVPDLRPTYMAHQVAFQFSGEGTAVMYGESTSCRTAFPLTIDKIAALIERLIAVQSAMAGDYTDRQEGTAQPEEETNE